MPKQDWGLDVILVGFGLQDDRMIFGQPIAIIIVLPVLLSLFGAQVCYQAYHLNMEQTGAARSLAEQLVVLVGYRGRCALLAGLFILTAVSRQLISNTVAALIVPHRHRGRGLARHAA